MSTKTDSSCGACGWRKWSWRHGKNSEFTETHEFVSVKSKNPDDAWVSIRQSSQQWCDELGFLVLDPDGWDRTNYEESWAEPITEAEFRTRVSISTVFRLVA